MKYGIYTSPIGALRICADKGKITGACFLEGEGSVEGDSVTTDDEDGALLVEAFRQLDAYFEGQLRTFTLPLAPHGTAFQQKAWVVLCSIPYGETITYGAQARLMGLPSAFRAVGGANHRNPICIFIPCHRVVASTGMGGYGGGVNRKEFLLRLESHHTP